MSLIVLSCLWVSLPRAIVGQEQLLITEFVSWRDSGIRDADGELSDWLELHNAGDRDANLDGYYLTDDLDNLRMWRLPAMTLPAGQFLVILASGKDRKDPAGELHTNFQIDKDGEPLALISPDGATAVAGFVRFPEQVPDASYGLATDSTFSTVVARGATVRVLVPVDGSLGADWAAPDFDDGSWREGPTGVGFERSSGFESYLGVDVGDEMYDRNPTVYLRIAFDVVDPSAADLVTLRMMYDDGFVAFLNGVPVASANAPAAEELDWDSRATGSHPDSRATAFESFDISAHAGVLRAGRNVLAIHGLNFSPTSNDCLLLPELELIDVGETRVDEERYFPQPSPGGPNTQGFPAVAPRPEFSHDSGAYVEAPAVELTSAVPGAAIRYTLDGTVPDESSTLYEGPVVVNGGILSARVYKDGYLPGVPDSRAFVILHTSVQSFSSNIPIVITNTFGRQIPSTCDGLYTPGHFMIITPEAGGRAQITDPAHFADAAAFRRRGSSTCNREKFSFNVEVRDQEGQDKDVQIFDWGPDADYIMYGPYNFDRALMRNPFAYWLSNEVGRWAVRTRFVEVFLHMRPGPVTSASYHGVYVLMEKNKRGPDRIDVERLTSDQNQEPDVTGGYALRRDRSGSGEVVVNGGGYGLVMVYPKLPSTAQRAWIASYVSRAVASLDPLTVVDRDGDLIDVMSWIDHHILNWYPKNVDAFRLSGYMFKRRNGPLEMGPVWDYDRAMGCSDDDRARDPEGWDNLSVGDGGTDYFICCGGLGSWYGHLFQNRPPVGGTPWERAYRGRWRELRQGPLATQHMLAKIDEWGALLSEAAERNFQRWPAVRPRFGGFAGEVSHLKTWLARRADWIDSQFIEAPLIVYEKIPEGFRVEITVESGAQIYYTLDGTDPRATNNQPSSSAIEYTGPIIITENTRLTARAREGQGLWSGQVAETFVTRIARLTVTEMMYRPLDATLEEDPKGVYSPTNFEFLEMKNVDTEPVSLAGVRFTRGVVFNFNDSPKQEIAPGEVIVLVNEPSAFAARYGKVSAVAGEYRGSLSDRGETITLLGGFDERMLEFQYSSSWHPETDGVGRSLVNVDPDAPYEALNDAAAWRPSDAVHGTPGVDDSGSGDRGLQRPGDLTQDGRLNVSDAVGILRHLFSGGATVLPCGDGTLASAGNLLLLDADSSGSVDLTDAIHTLSFIFRQGPPHVLGTDCARIAECADACLP